MIRTITKIINISILILLISSGSALGASVTVCDYGCDYSKIADALNSVGNGSHTITVQNNYTAAEDITVSKSGTDANSRLTIQGKAGETVTVKSFRIAGNYITISNLTFNGNANHCIHLAAQKSYITVQDSIFNCSTYYVSPLMMYQAGISADWNTNIKIAGNRFNTIGYFIGIGGDTILFENNVVDGNYYSVGLDRAVDAIWIWGLDVTLRGNEVKNLGQAASTHVDFIQASGDAMPSGAKRIIIENNYFHDGEAQLCNLETYAASNYDDWTWRNNIFSNIKYRCNIGITGVKWYNNTFYNVGSAFKSGILSYASLGTRHYCTGGVYKNNISIGIHPYIQNSACALTADYNYAAGLNPSYSAVSGFSEAHGINGGNPRFVNIGTGNFKIQSGSPAINKGAIISGFNEDKIGIPRPQGPVWDIGAYEYSGSSLSAPENFRKSSQ